MAQLKKGLHNTISGIGGTYELVLQANDKYRREKTDDSCCRLR
jgi:hypothetical protein